MAAELAQAELLKELLGEAEWLGVRAEEAEMDTVLLLLLLLQAEGARLLLPPALTERLTELEELPALLAEAQPEEEPLMQFEAERLSPPLLLAVGDCRAEAVRVTVALPVLEGKED